MTLNNDLFVRPPADNPIPNDGVSQVGMPAAEDENQWRVLAYELENFVCEGEYSDGLERILGSYLTNQERPTQPAVWVSGFYGSGKSHLVRVLEHLWADTRLPNGASARGLVALPSEISDHLRELTNLGKRLGASPWSVAGSLDRGSAGSLNTAFLSIVLDAAGLPTRVAPAQVALWLIDEGLYESVARSVTNAGKDLRHELKTYNLSSPLSEAILAALPGFAPDAAAVRSQLKNQFPDVQTVTIGETLALLERVLRFVGGGQVPPTLVVLDEVQQYIGDDVGRALDVQHLVEAVTKETGNRVLLVATGQQEMTADPTLQRIRDRFTGKVVLKNQDVDAVVRRVLLAKDPARKPELERVLDRSSAEVSREVAGSRIAHSSDDEATLAEDYPLLPSRRRFWEHVLRAADAGRAGQLRSQLRIVHDAAAEVSSKPVGTVIGADYLYDAKNEDLNQTAQLSKGLQKLIADQRKIDKLRGRILGLIHLISLLPTSGVGDTGIRATPAHLADLLVEDLALDGARLRADVPRLLTEMADEGVLQEDGGEYRLQTEAGRAWEDAFRNQRANVSQQELVAKRDELLRQGLEAHLPTRVRQGSAKVSRTVRPHWGDDEPVASDDVAVWVRSEWDGVTPKQFETLARELGPDSPVVLLHLPKVLADDLAQELRSGIAAEHVLSQRGRPQDEEGRHAFASMTSRRRRAEERVGQIVAEAVVNARVLNGGGSAPSGAALRERVEAGAENAAARRFPRFTDGDDARWATVINRLKAGAGSDAALAVVGHAGDATSHRVVKEVLTRITGAGTKASDVVGALTAAPFGWPEDAVKVAFAVLVDGGHVHVTVNASDGDVQQVLATTRWGTVYLRSESVVLSVTQKLQARKTLTALLVGAPGDPVTNDNLVTKAGEAMDRLAQRAAVLSGPAPLPAVALPDAVAAIRNAAGNDRVVTLLAARDELEGSLDALAAMESRRDGRTKALADARALAAAAEDLEPARPARERLAAFVQGRDLLGSTDGVSPIVADLTSAVRDAVNDAARRLAEARASGRTRLEASEAWGPLDEAERAELLASAGLEAEPAPDLSTTSAVLDAVRRRPLSAWAYAADAVEAQVRKAIEDAVRRTAPRAVSFTPPGRTLRSADDVEAYVAELRTQLTDALAAADTVVVSGR
ncbi:BREX system P-loop protein BrxC [Cellulosimicrobium funkei]|uniref:BREX system P-loop protein BrxC n=1 Tax=Cellulosimicrobium funkei TaxID=264251 RepID=UPI0037010615